MSFRYFAVCLSWQLHNTIISVKPVPVIVCSTLYYVLWLTNALKYLLFIKPRRPPSRSPCTELLFTRKLQTKIKAKSSFPQLRIFLSLYLLCEQEHSANQRCCFVLKQENKKNYSIFIWIFCKISIVWSTVWLCHHRAIIAVCWYVT